MQIHSIRVRLTASIAVILALLVVVSVSAITSVVKINRQIETVDRKWLNGTQRLGDLKNIVSEFRVAESYRFLAVDQPGAIQAAFLAERLAKSITDLLARFEILSDDAGIADDLKRFTRDWQALLKQHRDWIAEAEGEPMNKPVGYGSALQKRYETVQLSAENLIDDAKSASRAEADAAAFSARHATALVVGLAGTAALLAIGLLGLVELQIARPLSAITTALSRLAAGDREIQVPGAHRQDEIGSMAMAFDVFRANAVALEDAQERAEALARHDALTGLANRRLFATELDLVLKRPANGAVCAVMLIDLDRFKPVNDLYGHAVGDLVLCEVASRLRDLIGSSGTVARLGGDEFAIITPPAPDRRAAADMAIGLASRIVSSVAERIEIEQIRIVVGASIGISICLANGLTTEEIMRAADLAMYRAKHDGRGTFRFFEDSMDAELRAKAELEADLRVAVELDDIKPYYQPLIDLASGRIVGFEVLARWQHKERGFVAPDLFIPLLEQLGGLRQMTGSIFRQAFRDAKAWGSDVNLAVNISPAQFQDVGFPPMLAAMLLEAEFPPHRLEIEVTETALVDNLQSAKFTLAALHNLGVQVVLDDFGTGYSSLSYLHELKFDKLKIDKSFVGNMAENSDSASIVNAVLGLAESLGMVVTAEGIETQEVLTALTARGCAYGQGYFFSRAVPATAVVDLLDGYPREMLEAG